MPQSRALCPRGATKQSASGDKDYQVTVQNLSSSELYIDVAAYRVGT